ncbi:MAG: hypothetical protein GY756_17800 [bacterium]|nr:hypothetical protein [bacterium]
MVKYRQEADNAKSPITRVKAMNKFFVYRDCIKELEQAINHTHCCEELKCDHEPRNPNKKYTSCKKCGMHLQMKP